MNELQNFEYLKFQYHKENLHDVFGTVLDVFPHVTGATVTGQVYLWEALQKIKYNLTYDITPDTYLLHKYINGNRNTAYDESKKQLPAICYNARFNGYKNTDHIKSITNLMFLDIDDFQTKQEALDYRKRIIAKYSWIVACNLSLSRLGLHVIALVDIIHGNKDYNAKYDFISQTYFDSRLDKSSKSLTRYTVLPFDYDIYINESPSVLNIDEIINEYRKGIRSAYTQNDVFTEISLNVKGISSAYNTSDNHLNSINNEIGICSVYNPPYPPEKIICTPYTFSSDSSLELIVNDAARKHKLKFRMEVDESHFTNPNIPIYIREGVDVIDVNLFPLRGRKIYEGFRHKFIGALTVKMLYLNAGSQENNNTDIRTDILKFILYINKTICEPAMTFDEVIKSYNANWRRYKKGEIDFSKYFRKQRAFWSKHSTLTANEKRSVTSKIKNAPTVEDSKRRIWEAMEQLSANNEKITQEKVATLSGLKLPTVKKYRKEYREFKQMLTSISELDILEIDGNIIKTSDERNLNAPSQEIAISDYMNHRIENNYFELNDIEEIEFVEKYMNHESGSDNADSKAEYSEDQLQMVYRRIFNSLPKDYDEKYNQRLYERFLECFHHLPAIEAKLLITPIENIPDNDFWKQFSLERNIKTNALKQLTS